MNQNVLLTWASKRPLGGDRTDEQVAAFRAHGSRRPAWEAACFDELAQDVLRLAYQMSRTIRVPAALMLRLHGWCRGCCQLRLRMVDD